MTPSEHGTGEVGPPGEGGGWRDGPPWGRTAPGLPCPSGFPRSRSVMLLRQPYVPSTAVQLEGDGFLAAGRLFIRLPRRLLCNRENPFPFRTSTLKVTVNLSPVFGAHTQTVLVRRTPLDYHVHNSFRCSRSIVDFFFLFSIPQSCNFLFSRRLDNAATLHNTTFA